MGYFVPNGVDPFGRDLLWTGTGDFRKRIEERYDNGMRDLNELWQASMKDYLEWDPENDLVWDCEDDMEEIIEAYNDFFSTGYLMYAGGYGEGHAPHATSITWGQHTGDGSAATHFFAGAAWEGAFELGDTAQFAFEVGRGWNTDANSDTDYALVGADFSDLFDTWSECECRRIVKYFAEGRLRLSSILPGKPSGAFSSGYRQKARDKMEKYFYPEQYWERVHPTPTYNRGASGGAGNLYLNQGP